MSAWPKVKLGEVLRQTNACVDVSAEAEYPNFGILSYGRGVFRKPPISGTTTRATELFRARAGQFVYSRLFAFEGAYGVVPAEFDGFYVSGEFPLFDCAPDRILPEFLARYLSIPLVWSTIAESASGVGHRRQRVHPESLLVHELPLPPLAEQRRVVERIEELAAQIHEARTLRQQAAEEAEALARAGIEQCYQQLQPRFGETKLADLCNTITDGDHITPVFSDDGVHFIFVGNVSSGYLHFENTKRVPKDYYEALKPHRMPRRGDILYSAVGATLGIPAVVNTDEPFCFQRHVAILKPDPARLVSRFGWHMLCSRTVTSKAWSSTTGSAQPTVPLRAIRELSFPAPPLPEQRRIVAELDALQAEVDALKRLQAETAAELDTLLPAILDRAFKGEL